MPPRRSPLTKREREGSQSSSRSPLTRRERLGGTHATSVEGASTSDVPNAFLRGLYGSSGAIALGKGLSAEEAAQYAKAAEDESWFSGLLEAAGGLIGDLPAGLIGAVAGGAAGSEVPVLGTAIGAGAGGFALPSMIRGAYNEYLQLSQLPEFAGMSMEDVALKVAKEGGIEGLKGAATGALVSIVPMLGALKKVPALAKVLQTPIGRATIKSPGLAASPTIVSALESGIGKRVTDALANKGVQAALEVSALTVTPAALEGRLPTTGEFATNAVLLGAFKAAAKIPSIGRKIDEIQDTKLGKIDNVLAKMDPETRAKLRESAGVESEFNATLQKFLDNELLAAQEMERSAERQSTEKIQEIVDTAEKKLDKSSNIPKNILSRADKGLKKTEKLFSDKEASEIRTEERRLERIEDAVHDYNLDKQSYEEARDAKLKQIKALRDQEASHIKEKAELQKKQAEKLFTTTQEALNKGARNVRELRDQSIASAERTASKGESIALNERLSSLNKANAKTKTFSKKVNQEINRLKDKDLKRLDSTADQVQKQAHKEYRTFADNAGRKIVKLAKQAVKKTKINSETGRRIQVKDAQGKPIYKAQPLQRDVATHARAANKAYDAFHRVAKKIKVTYEAKAKQALSSIQKSIDRLSKAIPSNEFRLDKTPEKFQKLADQARSDITKASDKQVRKLSGPSESSLEKQFKAIEDKAEREIKKLEEQAAKALSAAEADLQANLIKIKGTLDDITHRANELKSERLKGIDEKYKKELSEAMESLRSDLAAKRKAFEDQIIKQRDRRLEAQDIKNQTFLEKQRQHIRDRLKAAEDKVNLAKATGYFEVEARRLDPTAPKGKMVKKAITYKKASDIGKTDYQIAAERIKSEIPEGKDPRSYTAAVFDAAHDLKKMSADELKNNPGVLLEHIKTAENKARSIIEDGVFDYETHKVIHEGYSDILKKHFGDQKVDLEKLDAHLAAQTSLQRQNLGQPQPIPTETAMNLVNNKSSYAAAARDLANFMHAYLDRQVKGGLISAKSAARMKELYSLYAPLLRVIDPHKAKLYASAKGSMRDILSPSMSMVELVTVGEKALARNDMARALAHALMKEEKSKAKVVEEKPLSKQELQEMVGDFLKVNDEMATLLNEVRNSNDVGATANYTLSWKENGKKYSMKIDPYLHDIITNASKREIGMFEKFWGTLKNYFSASVTLFPTDLLRLSGMDLVIGGIQSKSLGKYLAAIPEAMSDAFFRKGTYRDWLRAGKHGLDDLISQGDFKYATDTFSNAIKKGDNSVKAWANSAYDFVTAPLRFLQDVSSRLGDIPRLAEFNNEVRAAKAKAKELGIAYDPRETAYRASQRAYESTTTYGREGYSKSIQMLNRLIPFARTIITSTQSFAKAIDPRTAQGRLGLMRATAALTIPTLYFWLKNRADPRYQALTQEQKDNYIWIYTSDDPNEEPIKIRKFWQYGWLFQTLPEKLAEFSAERDPKALEGLMRAFEYEFSPATILNIAESFHKGGVIIDPNKLFEGRYSTIPKRIENLDPEFQELESTSETAKFLGHKLGGLSPVWWDHAASMFGAKFGKEAMKSIDEFLIAGHIVPDSKMGKQLADSVLFGSFYGRGPGKSSSYLNKFYDIFNEHDARYKTYKRLLSQGRDKEAEDYIARKPFLPNKMLQNMRKNIGRLYKQIQEVEGRVNTSISDRQAKRAEYQELVNELTSVAKEYSEALDEELRTLGQSPS